MVAALLLTACALNVQGGVGLVEPKEPKAFPRLWPKTKREIPVFVAERAALRQGKAIADAIKRWKDDGLPIRFKLVESRPAGAFVWINGFGEGPCGGSAFSGLAKTHAEGYIGDQPHPLCVSTVADISQATIRHELGHIIGLHHEHHHCEAPLFLSGDFLKQQRFQDVGEARTDPNQVQKSDLHAFFECDKGSDVSKNRKYKMYTPYDPRSIMHYSLESAKDLTSAGTQLLKTLKLPFSTVGVDAAPDATKADKPNAELSEGDKRTIRLMYPP